MVSYRFFNRYGGVSSDVFASLNVGFGTGDSTVNIEQNRTYIKQEMKIKRLVSAGQVHGSRVYAHACHGTVDIEMDGYDGLITNIPGTGLMIQQADCQAVLLYDEEHHAIGAAHCGWRGSVANIIRTIVKQMTDHYDTKPSALKAHISPSLGPCCAEFINYRSELPESFHRFQVKENHFDFWRISADQLIQAGVMVDAIQLPEICTSCSKDFFSYRRAVREGNPVCGRQASVICLEPRQP